MKRLTPEARLKSILEAAIAVASRGHYQHITRREIAEEAGTSGPLVGHYLGSMANLSKLLMNYAVKNSHLRVIAQGLLAADRIAQLAPEEMKNRAREKFIW